MRAARLEKAKVLLDAWAKSVLELRFAGLMVTSGATPFKRAMTRKWRKQLWSRT
jgi:hypothetical protein